MSKRKNNEEIIYKELEKESPYRGDDSEEGSQLQSAALEEAMGNKKEE